MQEDVVTVKNRSLSLSAYQQLPLPDKSTYLQQCGFEITELPEVEALELNEAAAVSKEKERLARHNIKGGKNND